MAIWLHESRQFRQFIKITLPGLLALSFPWLAAALPSICKTANPDSLDKIQPRLVLSHNLSGWATGYSGPEFELRVRYWNGQAVLAGFRYAFYQPFGQRSESFSLRNFYPQLERGYVGYLGIGLFPTKRGTERLRLFAEYAQLQRNNWARICSSWEQPSPFEEFCICRQAEEVVVPYTQTRISLGLELGFPVFQWNRIGMELGVRIQGYVIRSDRDATIDSPWCGRSPDARYPLQNHHSFSNVGFLVDGLRGVDSGDPTRWSRGILPSLNLRVFYIIH
jgi:hypothetical protein